MGEQSLSALRGAWRLPPPLKHATADDGGTSTLSFRRVWIDDLLRSRSEHLPVAVLLSLTSRKHGPKDEYE